MKEFNLKRSAYGARSTSLVIAVFSVLLAMVLHPSLASGEDLGLQQRTENGDSSVRPKPPSIPVTAEEFAAQVSWFGPFTFRNFHSDKCLDILGASQSVDAVAVQYTCVAGGRSQAWLMYQIINDAYFTGYLIGNVHSGKCLAGVPARGTEVFQMDCTGSEYQIWMTHPDRPNIYFNYKTGYCMEVAGASTANFARILSWDCHNRAHQVWLRYNA